MKLIATAGNTIVPALLVLEKLGFQVSVEPVGEDQVFRATRGEENYVADDPVAVLGLVKLVEMRGWEWAADDVEFDEIMRRYSLE